jgi:TetR/AcrR family transcriptional regulator
VIEALDEDGHTDERLVITIVIHPPVSNFRTICEIRLYLTLVYQSVYKKFMDTRETLLEKAMSAFASRGYDAVGVQEIVDAAGVTKPTLYHHFGCKIGLLRALLEEHYTRLSQQVTRAAEYHRDLPLTLRRLALSYFRFSTEEPIFYRMQLSLYFAPDHSDAYKEVARLNEKQFRLIEAVFVQAAQDHGNMKGRHSLYAATFLGMINTCIGLALNGYLSLTDTLLERAVHQFEHGIYS